MSNSFTPYLFIGVGAQNHFYTLREAYLHTVPGPGPMGNAVVNGVYQGSFEVRSFHHFNLSQDADEAFAKAQEASVRFGYPLRGTVDSIRGEMDAIVRATKEKMEERVRRDAERQAAWEAEREASIQDQLRTVKEDGKFANGPYIGQEFCKADRGYITWLARKEFDDRVMQATKEAVLATVPEMVLPKPIAGYIGEDGQRMTFKVTVIASAHYVRDCYGSYGTEMVYITTMVDAATGKCLVAKTPSFAPNVGEEITIKATVKGFDEFRGQEQTIVQRIKQI